jgi:uncharacterized protein
VPNAPEGGVYYSFGKYSIQTGAQLSLDPGADPSRNAPPRRANPAQEYEVASYNLENLYDFRDDPGDDCDFTDDPGCPGVSPPFDYVPASAEEYERKLAEQARQIVRVLRAPDILLVQEAEDQDICAKGDEALDCAAGDGRPDTLQELALAIADGGGPQYDAALDRDGADDRGIVSGFLYRTDRARLIEPQASDPVLGSEPAVDYRGAPLAYNTDVQNPKALNAVLPEDVDRSTGTDGDDVFTRPPQVALFEVTGPGRRSQILYAVSNHFSSTPDARVGQRTEQARFNAAIAAAIAAHEGDRVLIGGDLNVYPRPDDPFPPGHPLHPSDQLGPLYDQGLSNLYDVLVKDEPAGAYSYVFEGQAQTLDQLFVSTTLRRELEEVRMAHINADWPSAFDADGARGASDHDPPVARFQLDRPREGP